MDQGKFPFFTNWNLLQYLNLDGRNSGLSRSHLDSGVQLYTPEVGACHWPDSSCHSWQQELKEGLLGPLHRVDKCHEPLEQHKHETFASDFLKDPTVCGEVHKSPWWSYSRQHTDYRCIASWPSCFQMLLPLKWLLDLLKFIQEPFDWKLRQ